MPVYLIEPKQPRLGAPATLVVAKNPAQAARTYVEEKFQIRSLDAEEALKHSTLTTVATLHATTEPADDGGGGVAPIQDATPARSALP